MTKPICRFKVPAGSQCSHELEVRLYRTRRGMRRALTRLLKGEAASCLAACTWGSDWPFPLIACLHFSLDDLLARYVVHEAVHAARRRGDLVGDANDSRAEETLAEDVEAISDAVIRAFRKHGYRPK